MLPYKKIQILMLRNYLSLSRQDVDQIVDINHFLLGKLGKVGTLICVGVMWAEDVTICRTEGITPVQIRRLINSDNGRKKHHKTN